MINTREHKDIGFVAEQEFKILEKFHDKPKEVENSEKEVILKLAGIGYLSLGICESEDHQIHEIASLTSLGNRIYHRQKNLRNPVSRLVYKLGCLLSQ